MWGGGGQKRSLLILETLRSVKLDRFLYVFQSESPFPMFHARIKYDVRFTLMFNSVSFELLIVHSLSLIQSTQ